MVNETMMRIDKWIRHAGDVMYPLSRIVYDYVFDNEERGSVLDIGCGVGAGIGKLSSVGFRPTGIDIDLYTVQLARGLYPWISFFVYDLSQDPLDDTYDLVLSVESLEHMTNQAMAVRNMIACAKKKVIICTPDGSHPSENAFHAHELSSDEMQALVKECPEVKTVTVFPALSLSSAPKTFASGNSIIYVITKELR